MVDTLLQHVYTCLYKGVLIMITSLKKWGNSVGIRIPQEFLRILKLAADTTVSVTCEDNKIIIKAADEPTCLADLFKDYDGDYKPQEIDWGKPVGKEVW